MGKKRVGERGNNNMTLLILSYFTIVYVLREHNNMTLILKQMLKRRYEYYNRKNGAFVIL